ncbi:MAG: hypothetical protein K2X66_03350, partial [Cyanobacteria bacterium]|nr:hypothetical protein [Cyanobacteriota bacterium]
VQTYNVISLFLILFSTLSVVDLYSFNEFKKFSFLSAVTPSVGGFLSRKGSGLNEEMLRF